jgi:hypothetical protein
MKYFLFDDVVRCLHRVEKKKGPKYRYVNDICRYFTFSLFFKSHLEFQKKHTTFCCKKSKVGNRIGKIGENVI